MTSFGPYSPIYQAGEFYFISGHVGINPDTGRVQETTAEQTAQIFTNLQRTLHQHQLDFQNIVKTTIFLTDMADFTIVNEVYTTYFNDPRPARSTVGVAELPRIGHIPLKVEIEAIARKRITSQD